VFGTTKNVAIPVKQLEKALDGDIMFDGSSIEGFVRIEESDMYLKPDMTRSPSYPGGASTATSRGSSATCTTLTASRSRAAPGTS